MAKKRAKKASWHLQIVLITMLIGGVVFSGLSVIMVIGMLPTIVAAIVDKSKGHVKTMTIGAMNFAGCVPFLISLWKKGGSFELALNIITTPRTIVIIYCAAGMGYLIDWAMTGIVASVLMQRSRKRLKDIQNQQKELTERWGPEVSGTIPLDEYGFPKEESPPNEEKQGAAH